MTARGNFLERLARPPEEIRSENLRQWATSVSGATRIADVKPRARCKVAGVIQNVRIDPREGRNYIEATINDGSGSMVIRLLGRTRLAGIRLGEGLVAEGMVAGGEPEPVLLNPEYDLISGPEHG